MRRKRALKALHDAQAQPWLSVGSLRSERVDYITHDETMPRRAQSRLAAEMQGGAPRGRFARFRAGLGAARAEKPFNIAAAVLSAAYTTLGIIAIALIGATINDRANDVVILSALDAPPKPCGVAVPSLARLMYDFNAYRWSDITRLPSPTPAC